MPYMPGTDYLTGFKFKTQQAISQPKVSNVVATKGGAFASQRQFMGGQESIGSTPPPMYAPDPIPVLQATSPYLMAFRAGIGLVSKIPVVKPLVKKYLPDVFHVGKTVPTREIVGTTATTAATVLTVKQVVDVIGPKAAGILGEGIQIGVSVYEDFEKFGVFGNGGNGSMGHPQAGTSIAIRPSGPTGMGIMPGGDTIVKRWHAGNFSDGTPVPFWRTMDGWIYVQRKDGTVKRYKPYKSVVLGKRPSSKQINRAINKLKREDKTYHKLTKLFHKPTRSKSAH